jgi:hypothetical protein
MSFLAGLTTGLALAGVIALTIYVIVTTPGAIH